MNGLAGYFSLLGDNRLEVVPIMLKALTQAGDTKNDIFDYSFLGGTIGISSPTDSRKKIPMQLVSSDADEVTCLILGDVYGFSAAILLQRYMDQGISCLEKLDIDGIFFCTILDKRNRKMHLVSDPFGLFPLYYAQDPDKFIFATGIKGILSAPDFKINIDKTTFFDFWTYGFALGDKTPVENIKLLPGGSSLTLDLSTCCFEINRYLRLEDLFTSSAAESQSTTMESVVDLFHAAVRKRSTDINTSRMGISLSGGLDSRAILAGLGDTAKNVRSYTLGLPGCADQHLALRMAKATGSDHDFVPISKDDLTDFESLAKFMVFLSDGLYHPHESTERVALNYLASDPFDTMLRGHGGELAKASLAYPFQATVAMQKSSPEETLKNLFLAASLGKQDIDWKVVFTESIAAEINNYGAQSLQVAATPAIEAGLVPADLCVYLYLSQWIPRQVVASLALFRSRVNVRLPYLDRNFLESLLRLPIDDRWDGRFHRVFVNKYAEKLTRIPDANTGAPLNAGAARLWITDKANSVLRRVGMPGFRHYTDFQSWQRKYFSSITEDILFSQKSLSRNFYNPEGLRQIFDLHVSGRKSYAHFLGTAVAIELWHRIFLESEPDNYLS